MTAPTEPGAARRVAQPPSLLSLPASCLEKVLQLALFSDDSGQPLQDSFGDPEDGAAVVWG